MAKILVEDREENTKVPFLRGILIRSLQDAGLSFMEALQKLADRGSVRLPTLNEGERREDWQRAKMLELGRFAARFYVKTLRDAHWGRPSRKYAANACPTS